MPQRRSSVCQSHGRPHVVLRASDDSIPAHLPASSPSTHFCMDRIPPGPASPTFLNTLGKFSLPCCYSCFFLCLECLGNPSSFVERASWNTTCFSFSFPTTSFVRVSQVLLFSESPWRSLVSFIITVTQFVPFASVLTPHPQPLNVNSCMGALLFYLFSGLSSAPFTQWADIWWVEHAWSISVPELLLFHREAQRDTGLILRKLKFQMGSPIIGLWLEASMLQKFIYRSAVGNLGYIFS